MPLKVWLKGEEKPGLAMTRAIGDLMASTVGVSCDPGKFTSAHLKI